MKIKGYSEKDVIDIISSGGIKQKVRLYLRDRASNLPKGTDFYMTFEQQEELLNSISLTERNEFNRIVCLGHRVESAIISLYEILRTLLENRYVIQEIFSQKDYLTELETLINLILLEGISGDDDEMQDVSGIRKKILTNGLDRVRLPQLTPSIDEYGFLDLHLRSGWEESPLQGSLYRDLHKECKKLYEYLAAEEAIREWIIEQEKFPDIPEYYVIFERYRDMIEKPLSALAKSTGRQALKGILSETEFRDIYCTGKGSCISHPATFRLLRSLREFDKTMNLYYAPGRTAKQEDIESFKEGI